MSVKVFYDILNQRSTPAIYTDTIANRPAFGFQGRLFISTDSGQIFEDTGSAWTLVADAGVGGGTLSSVCLNGNTTASGIVITANGLSSNSITNTGNTAGSVLFAGTGGLESQNNTKLFWDNTNFRLGINNASPGAPLDIHGTGTQLQINGTGSSNSYLNFQQAGTNKWRVGLTYSTGANYFDIYDNNSSVSRLSILNSGFIGAGTITPKEKLEVAGAVFSTGTNSNLGNFTGVIMDVYNPGTFQTGRIAAYDPAGSCLQLSTNNVGFGSAAALFINKEGKVSIAQDNSGSTNYGNLKVGVDASNMAITWNDLSSGYGYLGTGTGYAYVGTGGQLAFLRNLPPYTGGSIEMARFDLNGNFGIGTNAPLSKFHVKTGTNQNFRVRPGTDVGATNGVALNSRTDDDSALQQLTFNASDVIMLTSNNVGIGTSSPTYGLDILGTTSNTAVLRITYSGFAQTFLQAFNGIGYVGTLTNDAFGISTNSAERMRISSTGVVTITNLGTGSVTATSGVLSTVSDMNLKDEDGFIDNALQKVMNLKPRYFYWKEESGLPTDLRQLGFYAQEVNEALGEEAANTPKTENDKWGIYDRGMIAFLTAAIQEQQAQIEELKAKTNRLFRDHYGEQIIN